MPATQLTDLLGNLGPRADATGLSPAKARRNASLSALPTVSAVDYRDETDREGTTTRNRRSVTHKTDSVASSWLGKWW
jgi:hypothetical protein